MDAFKYIKLIGTDTQTNTLLMTLETLHQFKFVMQTTTQPDDIDLTIVDLDSDEGMTYLQNLTTNTGMHPPILLSHQKLTTDYAFACSKPIEVDNLIALIRASLAYSPIDNNTINMLLTHFQPVHYADMDSSITLHSDVITREKISIESQNSLVHPVKNTTINAQQTVNSKHIADNKDYQGWINDSTKTYGAPKNKITHFARIKQELSTLSDTLIGITPIDQTSNQTLASEITTTSEIATAIPTPIQVLAPKTASTARDLDDPNATRNHYLTQSLLLPKAVPSTTASPEQNDIIQSQTDSITIEPTILRIESSEQLALSDETTLTTAHHSEAIRLKLTTSEFKTLEIQRLDLSEKNQDVDPKVLTFAELVNQQKRIFTPVEKIETVISPQPMLESDNELKEHGISFIRYADISNDELLLFGERDDTDLTIDATQSHYLNFEIEQHFCHKIKMALNKKDTRHKTVVFMIDHALLIISVTEDLCFTTLTENALRAFSISPFPNELNYSLMPSTQEAIRRYATHRVLTQYNLQFFLSKITLLAARGRIPRGIEIDIPFMIERQPDLSKIPMIPGAIHILSLWANHPSTLYETCKIAGFKQKYIFSLFSVCFILGLITSIDPKK